MRFANIIYHVISPQNGRLMFGLKMFVLDTGFVIFKLFTSFLVFNQLAEENRCDWFILTECLLLCAYLCWYVFEYLFLIVSYFCERLSWHFLITFFFGAGVISLRNGCANLITNLGKSPLH